MAAKLKKTGECLTDCDKALELDPNYTKAALRRAKCYMETEQYEEAIRDYERILKSDKSNMEYRSVEDREKVNIFLFLNVCVCRQLLQEAKLELKKSKRKDYYKILGVEKSANDDEIKKAYRKRALVHHPGKLS